MVQKIKNVTISIIHYAKDVQVVGLVVFCVILLLVSWNGLSAIQSNYELQLEITELEEQNKVRELAKNNLELQNQYFNTDQYLELEARRQFGRAAPGETVVLVPKEVALSRVADVQLMRVEEVELVAPQKPLWQQNFESWTDFMFGRNVLE